MELKQEKKKKSTRDSEVGCSFEAAKLVKLMCKPGQSALCSLCSVLFTFCLSSSDGFVIHFLDGLREGTSNKSFKGIKDILFLSALALTPFHCSVRLCSLSFPSHRLPLPLHGIGKRQIWSIQVWLDVKSIDPDAFCLGSFCVSSHDIRFSLSTCTVPSYSFFFFFCALLNDYLTWRLQRPKAWCSLSSLITLTHFVLEGNWCSLCNPP